MRKSAHEFVTMRLSDTPTYTAAYADPPYVGQAKKHYKDHVDFDGEVDYAALIESLDKYDGFALSASSVSLRVLLPLCPPEARVMAWVKTFCAFKSSRVAYSWEPVIVKELPRTLGQHPTRDFVAEPMTLKKGLVGVKPERFCYWLFNVIGLRPCDNLVDLFPGSGAVSTAWDSWCAAGGPKIQHKISVTTELRLLTKWKMPKRRAA